MQHYALKVNITEENTKSANFKSFAKFEFSKLIKHELVLKTSVDFLNYRNTGEHYFRYFF